MTDKAKDNNGFATLASPSPPSLKSSGAATAKPAVAATATTGLFSNSKQAPAAPASATLRRGGSKQASQLDGSAATAPPAQGFNVFNPRRSETTSSPQPAKATTERGATSSSEPETDGACSRVHLCELETPVQKLKQEITAAQKNYNASRSMVTNMLCQSVVDSIEKSATFQKGSGDQFEAEFIQHKFAVVREWACWQHRLHSLGLYLRVAERAQVSRVGAQDQQESDRIAGNDAPAQESLLHKLQLQNAELLEQVQQLVATVSSAHARPGTAA